MNNHFLLAIDLDGTLINRQEALENSYAKSFNQLNIKIDGLTFLKQGLSFIQICNKIELLDNEKQITLINLKDKFYFENLSLTKINAPIFNLM